MGRRIFHLFLGGLVSSLLLAGCGSLWGINSQRVVVTQPALVGNATPADGPKTGQANLIPVPAYLWISPAVPENLRKSAMASGLALAASPETATIRLDILNSVSLGDQQSTTPSPLGIKNPQSSIWIYALVTPFPTTTDGVALVDIQNAWTGTSSGPFAGRPIWMDYPTLMAFRALWGAPASGVVRLALADQLVDSVWAERPAWAIVPFEAIEPRWKVLSVDGQSPVHNNFDPQSYALKINFSLHPAVFPLPPTNRDPDKLTVLAMTGVTALVRATADRMEKKGVLYPGEQIRNVLRNADLAHVSNEVSFDANCPTPDPLTESLFFCSNPRYIALLEDVGVDIVELTGNHLLDYGPADLLTTLEMYDRLGWKYFGGGRDLQAALQPALVEHNGNKLAFIGCNFAGPPDDWATDTRPGSAPCILDKVAAEITHLRAQGFLPVMTFQYSEYYQSIPTTEEQANFRRMADAGAVIVSGSQAHMPATLEFHDGAFVHYGLGNLFFDQMSHRMPDGRQIYDTRNGFVDRHIFYAGRYIGTELLTYIIEDYALPRLMTSPERTKFLQHIFSAAGW